jgi:hypothetical protein
MLSQFGAIATRSWLTEGLKRSSAWQQKVNANKSRKKWRFGATELLGIADFDDIG